MTKRDECIIAALLTYPSIREAAKACNVSESTIYTRLKNEAFKAEYDASRERILKQTTAYVQGLMASATKKMETVMNDPESSAQTVLNAADAIMRHSYRLTEQTDILERLDRLEQAAKEGEKSD